MLRRTHWMRHIASLDPAVDYEEIYRTAVSHEFPWDVNQALSFALFRTYAVPSIGALLDRTGEFARSPQRRYDDTVLLLDEIGRHGLRSDDGRRALRRVNRMHGTYRIGNDDMRYVLATFVVVPKRWLDEYGWRPLTPAEVAASVRYHRELGALMGIKDVPETYAGFAELLDSYEAAHFAFDAGGRRVADATLRLLTTFYPRFAAPVVESAARALMDPPVLAAFGYPRPPAAVVAAVRAGLRVRAAVVRQLPARRAPVRAQDLRRVRSYPDGYDVDRLGTFPRDPDDPADDPADGPAGPGQAPGSRRCRSSDIRTIAK